MASGTIKRTQELLDVTSSSITFNSAGTTSGSSGTVKKWGHVVTINGICVPITSGINLTLASIPSEYRPSGDTWLSTDYYAPTFSGEAEARVNTNGFIVFTLSSNTKNQFIKFSGSWII